MIDPKLKQGDFRSALRFSWLTRHYDQIADWTMNDRRIKLLLINAADIRSDHRVLDFGCGTGSLALMLHTRVPTAEVVGVDVDAAMLAQAERKSKALGARVKWIHRRIEELSVDVGSFDRVVSSLVFHHLRDGEKASALGSLFALSRPGGAICLADFGRPHGPFMRAAFLPVRLLDGFDRTRANVRGELPSLIHRAGFEDVCEIHRVRTMVGSISLYHARKPVEPRK